jgi:hypothetical protein
MTTQIVDRRKSREKPGFATKDQSPITRQRQRYQAPELYELGSLEQIQGSHDPEVRDGNSTYGWRHG